MYVRRKQKGITLLGELVGFMSLVIMAYFTALMVIHLSNVSEMLKDLHVSGGVTEFDVTVTSRIMPIRQENALISLMDVTYNNVPFKKLLYYAVEENNIQSEKVKVTIDDDILDLGDIATELLSNWNPEKDVYYLVMSMPDGNSYALTDYDIRSGEKLRLQKAGFTIPSSEGYGKLTLYVG
jgi:hypothetical protein